MDSIRSGLAEAVLRTIVELERKHGIESPQLVGELRSRVLLRLSDRLTAVKPGSKVLLIRAEQEKRSASEIKPRERSYLDLLPKIHT